MRWELDVRQEPRRRDAVDAAGGELRAGKDRTHAAHSLGAAGVDGANASVRMRAAHERGVGRAGERYVVGVAPAPGEKASVLASQHARTEHRIARVGLSHGEASLLD